MKIKQNDGEMILQDAPGCLWLFGSFFAVIGGIFLYGSLGGFHNFNEVPLWGNLAGAAMGAIGVAVGVWKIGSHPASKTVIDRQIKTVTHAERGLFGKSEKTFHFENIRRFFVREDKDGEGDPIWKVEMELLFGESVEVTRVWSRNLRECETVAANANEFLGK